MALTTPFCVHSERPPAPSFHFDGRLGSPNGKPTGLIRVSFRYRRFRKESMENSENTFSLFRKHLDCFVHFSFLSQIPVLNLHRMPAKETHSKTCGPIGCKEAVRAEIAPARRKASREGNIVRAVPRACLGLAKFILRPAPRLMRYARKEPPCCTNLLNVREYSAD